MIIEMDKEKMDYKLIFTGQHSETMEDLLADFGLSKPDEQLYIKGEVDTKLKLFKWIIQSWQSINNKPYLNHTRSIIVHGDTMSTLLGALIGWKHKIPVVHIEAGLRSYNYLHPFPEELIRILVSKLSKIHFCPSESACENIKKLKTPSRSIINTRSNTLLDSLRYALGKDSLAETRGEYCVVSIHRNETLSNQKRFDQVMEFVIATSQLVKILFVLHPVTRRKIDQTKWGSMLEGANIELSDRTTYVNFINILKNCKFLITDGGSNQEEAAYMGLPCLVMRYHTERMDGLGDNAVLSEFNRASMDKFVHSNLAHNWKLKPLPKIYPSKDIVSKLISI